MNPIKIQRTCPICRTQSYHVVPSSIHLIGEEKKKAKETYIKGLNKIPCKHFSNGEGFCPFAPNCFFAHLNKDGTVAVDKNGKQNCGKKNLRKKNPSINNNDLDFIFRELGMLNINGSSRIEMISQMIQELETIGYFSESDESDNYDLDELDDLDEDESFINSLI